MDVIIVGAGPTGLTLGAALARRRHASSRSTGTRGRLADGSWRRRGVMQFEQAHGFRPQVHDLLLAEWPEAWQAWRDLGAEPSSYRRRVPRRRRSVSGPAVRPTSGRCGERQPTSTG